jgi:hypothetical protein
MLISLGPLIGLALGVDGERQAVALMAMEPHDARVLARSLKDAADALSQRGPPPTSSADRAATRPALKTRQTAAANWIRSRHGPG